MNRWQCCFVFLSVAALSCNSNSHKTLKDKSPANNGVHNQAITKTEIRKGGGNQADIGAFFKSFKVFTKARKKNEVAELISFPLQTLPVWSNDELKNQAIDVKSGLINKTEFEKYYDDIFSAANVHQIAISVAADIKEIPGNTTDDYYKQLLKLTDTNAPLYELFIQYAPNNGNETSFGFVFGQIGGGFKVLSFYSPWPVKDN